MRVQIFPHDTTDSIVTTVKNFYGLYEGATKGVSFEDEHGNTLIARYENFRNHMVIYVRVVPDYSQSSHSHGPTGFISASPISADRVSHQLEEPSRMLPPHPAQILNYGQPTSRPASRIAGKRSASPRTKSRRSESAHKGHGRSGIKSRETSTQGNFDDLNSDAVNGYSSGDGGAGSVTSSRKARSEQLASAEISLDNILEGGRRKRAKFESSVSITWYHFHSPSFANKSILQELPLFVPPQVPAPNSISSISPQRRSNAQDNPSPFARPAQRPFAYHQPLQSPQSYGQSEQYYGIVALNNAPSAAMPVNQHGHRLRDRVNVPSIITRSVTGTTPRAQGFGILPTPDPTVASCISDEDVALQLMRLGDASNLSRGRTSASTLDDALSGRADAASSATSDSGDESDTLDQPSLPLPQLQPKREGSPHVHPGLVKKHSKHVNDGLPSFDSTEHSGDERDEEYQYDEKKDGGFRSDPEDLVNEYGQAIEPTIPGAKSAQGTTLKARNNSSSKKNTKSSKPKSAGISKKAKPIALSTSSKPPMSPASAVPHSRKTSSASTLNFQHHLGADEEDLSSKPRCQRCRKSKKGCDRQRPCQRCKDAGIGPDGCVSEDEGNGRKGRFGRHMGVSVKKDNQEVAMSNDFETAGAILTGMSASPEKSKKRKR